MKTGMTLISLLFTLVFGLSHGKSQKFSPQSPILPGHGGIFHEGDHVIELNHHHEAWKAGYIAGYRSVYPSRTPPIPPTPTLARGKDYYTEGYNAGRAYALKSKK